MRALASLAIVLTTFAAVSEARAQSPSTREELRAQSASPGAEGAAGGAEAPRTEDLELALRIPLERFDTIRFIGAARAATTAIFELYCGVGMLIPDPADDGLQGEDLALGIGCLVGSTALFVVSGLGIADLADDTEHFDRLRRFRRAARGGLTHEERMSFELELESEADAARVRRGFSIGLGSALVIAAGIIAGLTVADVIEGAPGVSISTGCTLTGLASLLAIFLDSPAEEMLRNWRAVVDGD